MTEAENPQAQPEPEANVVTTCSFDDFTKIHLRVAEVLACEPHPNADKLYKLQIRLGQRTKQICAGIRAYYAAEELVGRRIIVVDNLEPRKLRGEVSEGMLLAAREPETGRLSLLTVDKPDLASGCEVG